MSEQPAGWYPDPYAALPGTERWWDGGQWLAQTREAPQHQAAGHAPAAPAWAERSEPRPSGYARAEAPRTADGGVRASWSARLGAWLIDLVPFVVLSLVMLGAFGYFDLMSRAVDGDEAAMAEAEAMLAPGSGFGTGLTLAILVAHLLYNVGFHVATGQTPGKRLVGIRVRMVDEDRRPTPRAALVRWIVQQGGPQLLTAIPGVGLIASVFTIVDHLFPLWDKEGQAIHDKAARTLVVRAR